MSSHAKGRTCPVSFTESEKENLYYNIPIANTTSILLGTGTSITQAAMRMLSRGCFGRFVVVAVRRCLWGQNERMTPQSEYRPTEYIQGWLSWWWDEGKRLQAAKQLQLFVLHF